MTKFEWKLVPGLQLAGGATSLFSLIEEGEEGKSACVEERKPNFKRFPCLP